jgi:hypothetical protein
VKRCDLGTVEEKTSDASETEEGFEEEEQACSGELHISLIS